MHALGIASWGGGAKPADAGGHGDGGLQGHHRVGAAVVAVPPTGQGGAVCIIYSYRGLRCGVSVARGRDLDDNELTCIINKKGGNTVRTVIVRNGMRIPLGKQGENKAVRVVWPEIAEKYTKLYGDGRFELVVVQKGQAYPAVVSVDGADLVWDVLAADVATVGAGSLELIYYVGDTIAKSQTWETFVVASKSAEGTTTPPDPAKNWVDTVLKSSSDAKQAATESAESAKQAAASREAIENMQAAAVSLSPNSKATVEKSLVDGRVKLTFGIPKGENGIFWLNTAAENKIVETFDEIVAAWKAGKSILVRDTVSFPNFVAIAPAFLIRPVKSGNDIIAMVIVCGGSARGSSEIGAIDAVLNVTYYITSIFENATFELKQSINADIALEIMPNESQLNGSPGVSNSASPVDHVHPAPFPNWTSSIGKALFVNNNNKTPSQAFEWRDVPNGDFTSKVGDFLRVAEVDTQGKPTAWETVDALSGGEIYEASWREWDNVIVPEGGLNAFDFTTLASGEKLSDHKVKGMFIYSPIAASSLDGSEQSASLIVNGDYKFLLKTFVRLTAGYLRLLLTVENGCLVVRYFKRDDLATVTFPATTVAINEQNLDFIAGLLKSSVTVIGYGKTLKAFNQIQSVKIDSMGTVAKDVEFDVQVLY